jgi:hypothetical protein
MVSLSMVVFCDKLSAETAARNCQNKGNRQPFEVRGTTEARGTTKGRKLLQHRRRQSRATVKATAPLKQEGKSKETVEARATVKADCQSKRVASSSARKDFYVLGLHGRRRADGTAN